MSPIYSNWNEKKKNIFCNNGKINPTLYYYFTAVAVTSTQVIFFIKPKQNQTPKRNKRLGLVWHFFMTLVFLERAKMENYPKLWWHSFLSGQYSTVQSQYRPPSTYHIHKNNAIKQTSASEANLLLASINNPVVNIHTDFWWCPYCANLIVPNLRWWGFALITWLDNFFPPPLAQPNTSSLLWLHVN